VKADIRSNPKARQALMDASKSISGGSSVGAVTPTTVIGTKVIQGGDLQAITAAVKEQREAK
jgi:hypothetical protein